MSYSSTIAEQHPDDVALGDGRVTEAPVETTAEVVEETKEPELQKETGKPVSWEQRRINKLVRDKAEAERRANLAEETARQAIEYAKKASGVEEKDSTAAPPTREEFSQAVDQAAAKRQFDAVCTEIYNNGIEELPGFESRLRNFTQVGGLNPTLIEAALESAQGLGSPSPQRILHELGGNLDEAARILELSPIRMAAAVARFAAGIKEEEKKVTAAPKPITPITPAASPVEKDPEKLSPKEWREWREKQLSERAARRR